MLVKQLTRDQKDTAETAQLEPNARGLKVVPLPFLRKHDVSHLNVQ
jgi:hypothetical protein